MRASGITAGHASDEPPLPAGFRFGVSTSAFQVEGGLNGPGEPANNWAEWEREGRVEPSGIAVDFWNRYEELLDRTVAMGCDTFRLGVEWARVEPAEGEIDEAALDRYAQILDACHERKLEPLVTLHHFTHPAWLGADFWLSPESPERFAAWVARAVERLAGRCRLWITINEIGILGPGSYGFGIFPPGRRRAIAEVKRMTSNLLAAHVRAYEEIRKRQPDAIISTNNAATSIYESDRMLMDLLLARSLGVAREDVSAWIAERREAWYAEIPPAKGIEHVIRRFSSASSGIGCIPRMGRLGAARKRGRDVVCDPEGAFRATIDAVYSSPHERTQDVLTLDYYDPVMSNHLRRPGRRTAGGRALTPAADHWDHRVNPAGLTNYMRANLELSSNESAAGSLPPLELWVAENGMASRVLNGRGYERLDGWDRPRFLRENLAALIDALGAGLPIGGYLHWSLVDNYEWGSYQPRFGIHGVDRERGARVLDTDSMGRDSASTYRRLIEGLRAGDRSVLESA